MSESSSCSFVQAKHVMQAYAATDPAIWGVDRQNYCCRGFALGCPPAPVPPKSAVQQDARKAKATTVKPVARCRSGAVAAVYRCTANEFQAISAVGFPGCMAAGCCG